jgi:hypothetical protein
MLKLENFVMIRFENDTMVQPIVSEVPDGTPHCACTSHRLSASQWFGWYVPGQDQETVFLNQTDLYTQVRDSRFEFFFSSNASKAKPSCK